MARGCTPQPLQPLQLLQPPGLSRLMLKNASENCFYSWFDPSVLKLHLTDGRNIVSMNCVGDLQVYITNQPVVCKQAWLKVPKREIFDRSDFPDFYTIKSLHVGDFRVKMGKIFKNIQGFIQGCNVPYAYAQSIFREVFFISFGQKNFFSVELLRPLVSVNNDFLKFFIFQVL